MTTSFNINNPEKSAIGNGSSYGSPSNQSHSNQIHGTTDFTVNGAVHCAIGNGAAMIPTTKQKVLFASAMPEKKKAVDQTLSILNVGPISQALTNNFGSHCKHLPDCSFDTFKDEISNGYEMVVMAFHACSTHVWFKNQKTSMDDVAKVLRLQCAGTTKLVVFIGCENDSILKNTANVPMLCSNANIMQNEAPVIVNTIAARLMRQESIGSAIDCIQQEYPKLVHNLKEDAKNMKLLL